MKYDFYLYGMILRTNSFLLDGDYPEPDTYGEIAQRYTLPGGETGTAATVLHCTPFKSYPSGVTARASKRYEYLQWVQNKNGYIIEDNFDSELTVSTKNDDTIFSLDKSGRVIYVNTFSHTIAPSMRAGYMVLPENMLDKFAEKLGFYSCTVPVFEQYVLAELINNGDFERNINRVRRLRRKSK